MVLDGDWLWVENTVRYADEALQSCTLESYGILLTNVTSINLIKNFLIKKLSAKIFVVLPPRTFIAIFFRKLRINLGIPLCSREKTFVPFSYHTFLQLST